jgi:hypothetical protein
VNSAWLSCVNVRLCERLGVQPILSGRCGVVKLQIRALSCVRALPGVTVRTSALASSMFSSFRRLSALVG